MVLSLERRSNTLSRFCIGSCSFFFAAADAEEYLKMRNVLRFLGASKEGLEAFSGPA